MDPGGLRVAAGFLALWYTRLEVTIKSISGQVLARREAQLDETIAADVPMSGAATAVITGTAAVRVIRRESRRWPRR